MEGGRGLNYRYWQRLNHMHVRLPACMVQLTRKENTTESFVCETSGRVVCFMDVRLKDLEQGDNCLVNIDLIFFQLYIRF